MTAKHDCSGTAYEVTGFHRCFRNATVERDGKWYCWQHDPERVEADKKKRRAGWEAEMDREAAKYARIALNARLGALVTEELAALLEGLAIWIKADAWEKHQIGPGIGASCIQARATAASIREALDEH